MSLGASSVALFYFWRLKGIEIFRGLLERTLESSGIESCSDQSFVACFEANGDAFVEYIEQNSTLNGDIKHQL